jgi:sulfite exporter TauE/SafE
MSAGLMLAAFLMGLGGIPHCAAMCGAACAAAFPRGLPLPALLGRCIAYASLGALAAASSGLMATWGRQVSFLKPFWVLAQVFAVVIGCWLAWHGRTPLVVDHVGSVAYRAVRDCVSKRLSGPLSIRLRPSLPFVAGLAWGALPCGLLYAALVLSALAPDALSGALVMFAFALPSGFGVWATPRLLARLREPIAVSPQFVARSQASSVVPVVWLQGNSSTPASHGPEVVGASSERRGGQFWGDPRWAVRLSGISMAAMSAWSVSHQLLTQWRAWCA